MLGELNITRGQAARYTLLPQVLPRLIGLFGSGFIQLPYFIAVVLNTVGILPNGHPYLLPANRGTYSFVKALAAGAQNIEFNRNNIDRIAIFTVLLSGIVMFFLQLVLLIAGLFSGQSFAADYDGPTRAANTQAFFKNDNPDTDIAFRLLDLVFGIPGIFNSVSADTVTTPFHTGFHALLQFYSFGILLVGVFIIIYLTTAVVLETAESGDPFGKRFNTAWAPVRLILFFGLLLPTGNGINLAQYILLNAAKLGSNVATNGWIQFDKTAKSPYLGTEEQMIAMPNAPDMDTFASFMALAKTCAWAEGRVEGYDIKPYFVFKPGKDGAKDISNGLPAFTEMAKNAEGGTMFFRFGVQDEEDYKQEMGAVFPYCGELGITITDQSQPGAVLVQQAYAELIMCLWSGRSGSAIECSQTGFDDMGRDYTNRYSMILPYNPYPDMTPHVGPTQRTQVLILLNQDFEETLKKAVEKQVKEGKWSNEAAMEYGWAGAGIWFNKIAEQNGALTSAVYNTPEVVSMPYVMEFVKTEKQREDPSTPLSKTYTPTLSSDKAIQFEYPEQRDVLVNLNKLFTYWGSEHSVAFFKDVAESQNKDTTGNVIIDVMNAFMGTRGLFDMCKNTNIHPLAQLSTLGRGMIEHSIRGFATAAGIGVGSGILVLLQKADLAQALLGATKFFLTFAGIGLLLGFILFYVLPFLPFIYFFFAVMTWVKSIFEAMVGMPLWALAHLRIEGDGMPGDSGAAGYFYILEIFIRPIAIMIGFLGSVVIFAALVKVLNQIFYLLISNLSGHAVEVGTTNCFQPPGSTDAASTPGEEVFKRGVIDEFFYTVIYTIIVYMIGLSCFKLVDLIPDTLMRWMGAGISTFGAEDGEPAENLMSYVSAGAATAGSKLQQGLGRFFD